MKLYLNILCLLLLATPLISAPSAALQKTILAITQTEPDSIDRKVLIRNLENIADNADELNLGRSLLIIEQSLLNFDFRLKKVIISALCIQLERDQRSVSKEFKQRHVDFAVKNIGKCLTEYKKPAKNRARELDRKEFIEKTRTELLRYANQKRAEHQEKSGLKLLIAAESDAKPESQQKKLLRPFQRQENMHLDRAINWAAEQNPNMAEALQNLRSTTTKDLQAELETITAELSLVSGYTAMLIKSAICGKIKNLLGFELRVHKYAQKFIKEHGQTLSFDQILTQLESRKTRRSESETSLSSAPSTSMDSETESDCDTESFYTARELSENYEFKSARGY